MLLCNNINKEFLMQPTLNIAIKAARLAGDIISRHASHVDNLKIKQKNARDYFSEVDIKAEQAIISLITRTYPDHGIIAEESGSINQNAQCVWVIDPLDGTSNYLHGYPFYGVSIALMVKNIVEHAVVYDPLRHECFAASRGFGARLNDARIRVTTQKIISRSIISSGFPSSKTTSIAPTYIPKYRELLEHVGGVRRSGSAALDLCYVAAGRIDGFWELGLNIWDIAAASLILKEAGGLITDDTGEGNYLHSGNVVAATPKIFPKLLDIVRFKS